MSESKIGFAAAPPPPGWDRVNVAYCVPNIHGYGYSSGAQHMRLSELGEWLLRQLNENDGKPILITAVSRA